MAGQITIILEIEVNESRLEEFKSVAKQMVETTQANEPGVLGYNSYFSLKDARAYISVERYANAEALMAHGMAIMPLMMKGISMGSITRMSVFGEVGAGMRPQLESMGATFYPVFEGFTRE